MARPILVFDASPLNHFARAGELVTLRELVADFECVTTRAVIGELRTGTREHQAIRSAVDLEWIKSCRATTSRCEHAIDG